MRLVSLDFEVATLHKQNKQRISAVYTFWCGVTSIFNIQYLIFQKFAPVVIV